ncbi:hypothetical protein TPA0909_53760 [Streptomyces albus]|nr:hypothetical protein TPA0909_53760 [Streptomyces albus]
MRAFALKRPADQQPLENTQHMSHERHFTGIRVHARGASATGRPAPARPRPGSRVAGARPGADAVPDVPAGPGRARPGVGRAGATGRWPGGRDRAGRTR